MSISIGIIAEDDSDFRVMSELTAKIIPSNSFVFKKFAGGGCGKLRRKCAAWTQNLLDRGCSHLVVLHDLDSNDMTKLRNELERKTNDIRFEAKVVLIPVQEIEAWLLSDAEAIRSVFNMSKRPTVPANPESASNPKEMLRDIVWAGAKKRYINTIHNEKIASALDLHRITALGSFRPYVGFLVPGSGMKHVRS